MRMVDYVSGTTLITGVENARLGTFQPYPAYLLPINVLLG